MNKQQEIEKIKAKYIHKEMDAMEKLRRLDRNCERPGKITAYVIGIIGTLIMGTGMSFALVWGEQLMIQGVVIGMVGMIFAGLAYPTYKVITKQRRELMAEEIIRLSEEVQ